MKRKKEYYLASLQNHNLAIVRKEENDLIIERWLYDGPISQIGRKIPIHQAKILGFYQPERPMNPNCFSFWYPKIQDCGIKTPKSEIILVTPDIERFFWLDDSTSTAKPLRQFFSDQVIPVFDKLNCDQVFCKNAIFADKTQPANCIATRNTIEKCMTQTNRAAIEKELGGLEEIILREVIPTVTTSPCSEYRICYDFDLKKTLFGKPHVTSDGSLMHHGLQKKELQELLQAMNLIEQSMKKVSLSGMWAIDLLFAEGTFWLIDMETEKKKAFCIRSEREC